MKKNRNILIVFIVLALIALALWLTRSTSTFRRANSDFRLDDSSTVTRIFMADKNNNSVTLIRKAPGTWSVNDRFPAQVQSINLLLKTMVDIEVKQPVARAAHDNIIREMAVNSVKVEIYQMVYRVSLFGVRWFPHEKLTKVYYVGGATQNNLGSFMLMQDSSEPFIVFLPGFRGFVSPRYSPIEKYWRDYNIVRKTLPEIASVKVEVPAAPGMSYEIRKAGRNSFSFVSLPEGQEVKAFDTLKVLNFLSGFRNLNFEALLNDMDQVKKDSILNSSPFVIITLTDTSGTVTAIRVFHKKGPQGQTDPLGNPLPYDLDRLYALVNDGRDFTLIQYFMFDKVLRPRAFFLEEGRPTGVIR